MQDTSTDITNIINIYHERLFKIYWKLIEKKIGKRISYFFFFNFIYFCD